MKMLNWFWLIPSLLILSACGTTRVVELADLEKQPDPKPIEAMQACAESLTALPADLIDRPVEEAVEVLTIAHAVDSQLYYECKLKQEDEARWIQKQ